MQDNQMPETTQHWSIQNKAVSAQSKYQKLTLPKQDGAKQRGPYLAIERGKRSRNNNAGRPTQETKTQTAKPKQQTQKGPTGTPRQEYQKPHLPTTEPPENTMREIYFHDPDEQRGIELKKQEIERREHVTPVRRDGYILPGDPNTLIS